MGPARKNQVGCSRAPPANDTPWLKTHRKDMVKNHTGVMHPDRASEGGKGPSTKAKARRGKVISYVHVVPNQHKALVHGIFQDRSSLHTFH